MSARELSAPERRRSARLQEKALAGTCGIDSCREPSLGFIAGMGSSAIGVCGRHAESAREHGYTVYTAVITQPPGPFCDTSQPYPWDAVESGGRLERAQ